MPASPQEGVEGKLKLLEMVKADLSGGKLIEWGSFCNNKDGYSIVDGTEEDVLLGMLKFAPWVAYDVYPVHGVDDAIAAAKKAAEQMAAMKR